jgi:two-component system, sensor histidine kinase and response regulator
LITNSIGVLKGVAHTKNIEIAIDIKGNVTIFVDHNIIGTVIRNLILKAIKFSQTGCIVNLSVQKKETEFQFFVTDTGIGIESGKGSRFCFTIPVKTESDTKL